MHKFVVSILIFSLVHTQFTYAHVRAHPVAHVRGIPGAVEKNRAGYGWLNTSSEAEAEALFLEECPPPGATGTSPCVPRSSALGAALQLASGNMEVAFSQLLKERIYEYTALQYAAQGKPLPALPACVQGEKMTELRERYNNLRGVDESDLYDQLEELGQRARTLRKKARPTSGERAELGELNAKILERSKLRAVRSSLDNKRMAEAFMLNKQLQNREDYYCAQPDQENWCLSIRSNRDRIRLSFPALFPGGVAEQLTQPDGTQDRWERRQALATELGKNDTCGNTPYRLLETSIARLIGLDGAPNPLPEPATITQTCGANKQIEAQVLRGQDALNDHYGEDDGYPKIVSNGDGIFDKAMRRANLDPADADGDLRLVQAKGQMESAIEDMKTIQLKELERGLNGMCGNNSLAQLAEKYPQALKQTVLDMNASGARQAMSNLLCEKQLMNRFQRFSQSHSCDGVTGDASDPAGQHVERQSIGFPFASGVNYDIKKQNDGSYKVKSKINYIFQYDPTINPSSPLYAGNSVVPRSKRSTESQQRQRFNRRVTSWLEAANKFWKKQSNAIHDPKVSFEIEKCTGCATSVEPAVNVSACYRSEEPDDFGTNFPGESFDPRSCKHVLAAGNWEDSGNYSFDTSNDTVMHETGHALGLADEYTADYYPAHAAGEDGNLACNSTMASNDGAACHRVYPRHLLEIIRPARVCPRP